MLDGVSPFPAEFAARYRELGYWEDRPLFDGFTADHPSLPYERILREWDELGYDQSVMDLVFHANAERVLGL
jgi:non-ribosomal peptide synthetase component E (peptide arylation enzyme)